RARPLSVGYRLRRFVRRRRLECIASAAVVLTILTAAIAFWSNRVSGPATMSEHRIELQGSSYVLSWTDGRRTMYWDYPGSGDLWYDDPSRSIHRVIVNAKSDDLQDWQPSRDVGKVALLFKPRPDRPTVLAVAKSDGSGYRELLREDGQGSVLGRFGAFGQWSWDSRWLLFSSVFQDEHRLLAISATDGTRRVVATWKSGELLGEPAFSPDGRFVEYGLHAEQSVGEGASR